MAIKLAHQQAKTPTDGKDVSTRDYTDTAAATAADDLATTGADVNVSGAAPPSAGEVLTAIDATSASWQAPAADADENVKVTGADTTPGGLNSKIAAGTNVSLAVLNPGANEQLQISSSNAVHALGGADHSSDTLANLNAKVSDATLIDTTDARLSDARDADAIITTSGPTTMPVGAVADGEFLQRSGGNIIGAVPASATSLDEAYNGGGTITVDAGAVILDADADDTSAALEITRDATVSSVARGISVSMGVNADGNGIEIVGLGGGTGLFVNKDGTGSAIDINQGGPGDAINITLDSDIAAQALVVTETSKARTVQMVHIVGTSTSSGTLVEIEKNDGTGIMLFLNNDETTGAGECLRIDNGSSSTSAASIEMNHSSLAIGIDLNCTNTSMANAGIDLDYDGTADGINVDLGGTSTAAQCLVLNDSTAVVRTNPTLHITKTNAANFGPLFRTQGIGGSTSYIYASGAHEILIDGGPNSCFTINAPDSAALASTDALITLATNTTEATLYEWIETISSGSDIESRHEANGDWHTDTGTYTTGAGDYAECMDTELALSNYEEGDVMVISSDGKVDKSSSANATAVVGAYSTNPSILGNNPISDLLMDQGVLEVNPWAWVKGEFPNDNKWHHIEIDGDQTANYVVGERCRMDAPYNNKGFKIVSSSYDSGEDKTSVQFNQSYPNLPLMTELYYSVPKKECMPVGMLGLVPTKCITENGTINPGDLLVTSSTAGHAMKAGGTPAVGTILGRAFETLTDTGAGTDTSLIDCLLSI
jgi:hypothetical protein